MAAGDRDLAVSPAGEPAALAAVALAGPNRRAFTGGVMTAAAGARRTGSAYARFLDWSRRSRWPGWPWLSASRPGFICGRLGWLIFAHQLGIIPVWLCRPRNCR